MQLLMQTGFRSRVMIARLAASRSLGGLPAASSSRLCLAISARASPSPMAGLPPGCRPRGGMSFALKPSLAGVFQQNFGIRPK